MSNRAKFDDPKIEVIPIEIKTHETLKKDDGFASQNRHSYHDDRAHHERIRRGGSKR
jgi:hypothetical protein